MLKTEDYSKCIVRFVLIGRSTRQRDSDNEDTVRTGRMRTTRQRRCITGHKWAVPLIMSPCRNQWWLIAAKYSIRPKTSFHRCFRSIAKNNLIRYIHLVLLTYGVVRDMETVPCICVVRSETDEQRVSGGSDGTRRVSSAVCAKKRC